MVIVNSLPAASSITSICAGAGTFACWFGPAFVLFYLAASWWESCFHEHILDVRPRTRTQRYRNSKLLSDIWFACFSHNVVHHHLTFRSSYVRQFRAADEADNLAAALAATLTRSQYRAVVRSQYGVSFTWSQARYFGLPLVANLGWIALCPSRGAAIAIACANLLGTSPYLICSKYLHPYLHTPFNELDKAPLLIRIVLRSRYGVAIRVAHFVHHRYATCNFNLQLAADLLRGRWRAPSPEDWNEMISIHLITHNHRSTLQGNRLLAHRF